MSDFPHNIEAEKAVLCAALVREDAQLEVAWLDAEQFYRKAHQDIWRAMQALTEHHTAIDTVTLAAELRKNGALEQVGGAVYLSELIDGASRSQHIGDYAKEIRESWLLRSLMLAGGKMAGAASDPGADASSVLADAEASILAIGQTTHGGDLVQAADRMPHVATRLEQLMDTKSGVTGLATGLTDLDRMTRGLQPGGITVIAARPSMGKTSLALNIASHVAETTGPVAVFSLETTADDLLLREVIARARVSANRVMGGYLNQSEYQALGDAQGLVASWPIWIDDGAGTTVAQIRSKARRLQHRSGLALIVVDYLQLMGGGDRRSENRTQEVSAFTRGFKAIAKDLMVPVLLLSQLNRGPEARAEKRPTLADLRESGSIEQDADLVVLLYRDEYYNPQTQDVGIAEAIIAKARNGPTGTVKLAFIGEQTRFANLENRV